MEPDIKKLMKLHQAHPSHQSWIDIKLELSVTENKFVFTFFVEGAFDNH